MNDCRALRKIVGELIVDVMFSGQDSDRCRVLKSRSEGRGSLMRVQVPGEPSVVVKTRRVQSLKKQLKRALGAIHPQHEFRVRRHVSSAGIAVPQPLALFDIKVPKHGNFEVIVMEDLGKTVNGLDVLKRMVHGCQAEAIREFELKVIDLTHLMVRAAIVDIDHQLRNFVVDASGRMLRIDLECARRRAFGRVPPKEYGTMLGRLVCSHVYACQPEIERSERFAAKLSETLLPSARVLHHAGQCIRAGLEHQRRRHGIDSKLRLLW